MDFEIPAELNDLQGRVRQFVEREAIPLEPQEHAELGLAPELLAQLRDKARAAGLWAPQLPREYGGLGLRTLGMCLVFEAAGRSSLGPVALNCGGPHEGKMHLLPRPGTDPHTPK